ncbi:hypothetical protein TNCV_4854391 [Trichonephila clavipes]|nr:hypothetical protein TNCV_4854391 [Trichonephila clavipes]
MRARAYCTHSSYVTIEVHERMSRSAHGQSEARPPVFKSPSKPVVLIYRPTAVGIKGRVDLAQPGNRTQTCAAEARYATTRPPGHNKRITVNYTKKFDQEYVN